MNFPQINSTPVLGLNDSVWRRYDVQNHEDFRHFAITELVSSIKCLPGETSLLDIGSGSQPYRSVVEKLNIKYTAHDFSEYSEELRSKYFGLHNSENPQAKPEIVCDALDIPSHLNFDFVLCTEVLEHVPDPAKLLEKSINLVKPGGFLLFTVPGSSWTHQAPYYFSSGLSPFWFEHHLKLIGAEVSKGLLIGNLRTNTFQTMTSLESLFPTKVLGVVGRIYRLLASQKKNFTSGEVDLFLAPVSQLIVLIKRTN